MMSVLQFDLPEEREEFERATKATDLCSFIWDFEQYLRGQWKYDDPPDDINAIWNKWHELKNEEGINMDKLYS